MEMGSVLKIVLVSCAFHVVSAQFKRPDDKTKCPVVKAIRNFDMQQVGVLFPSIFVNKTKNIY